MNGAHVHHVYMDDTYQGVSYAHRRRGCTDAGRLARIFYVDVVRVVDAGLARTLSRLRSPALRLARSRLALARTRDHNLWYERIAHTQQVVMQEGGGSAT
jgi:hypothetical protein